MTSRTVENNDVTSEFVKVVSESWPEQVYIDNDGNLQTIPERYEYRLGDNTQPVARYREHIVTTVSENLLTIITAKTGGGKSSNIPQYLFESGLFDKIAITQPRVVAARQLSEYVDKQIAKYINDDEHNLVGYQTAVEGKSSESNAILYVTDGLQLMREISKNGIQKNQVLVIDEYHERSGNMDALLAIAVEYGIRTVVMSATLDAKDLSEHYGEVIGEKVPIIDIPGANYEVNERESSDLDKEVIAAANQGKNILVFLPGRKEINSAMGRLRRRLPSSYTLLALHGDQTPEEQGRVFPSYPGGKIIFSTSVGQTSITIDDIDTVIDCGYERTQTLGDNGKYTLATQQSSRATADQRRGRVGRTKDGEYIRAQLRGFPPLSSISETDAYDTPAIKRTRSEDLQLKLAAFDHSMDSLPFYELPDEQEITRGRERLARLGLFKKLGQTALDGFAITERGKRAARLPLDVYSARMVLESRKYGAAVELQMMAAAAVQQIKGITHTAKGMENWRKLTSESESDIIAGIDFMVAAMKRTEKEQESSHIVELRFKKSFRAFEQLAARRHLDVYDLTAPDDEQRELLKKSIVAGTDEIFIKSGLHAYKDSHGKKRQPVSSTIIQSGHELLSGSSFNLQQVRHKKIATHALISAASSVTIDTLREVVPDRVTTVIEDFYIDKRGRAFTEEVVYFDGYSTRTRITKEAEPGIALHSFIVDQIFSKGKINADLPPNIKKARLMIKEFRELQHRTSENLGVQYSVNKLIEKTIREADYTSISFADIDPFIDIEAIKNIVPDDIKQEILLQSPSSVTIDVDGRSVDVDVEYTSDSDRAHVTVAAPYLHNIPFTIGEHRVNVRTSQKAPYVALERALEAQLEPSRAERRNHKDVDSEVYPNMSSRSRQKVNARLSPHYKNNISRR